MRRLLLLSVLAPINLASLPAAAADLPVRGVTLSNAGLAQIERRGPLAPQDSVTFLAPAEDIDDVLKSLLVADPSGAVDGVRLPAQDLAEEAFRGLPLRPDDFANRVALLRALRGQPVEAGGASGRLADAEESPNGLRITLITPRGLTTVTPRDAEEVRLLDAALAARVGRAAEALAAARSADQRQVEIRLRGATAPREVGVTYVAAAPLWKPSWRLVIPAGQGEARLQGWAVVENRSGSDWDGARLSLVSGNPAAFAQPLYTPIRVNRPELPVRAAERVQVQAEGGIRPPPPPAPMAAPMATMAAPRMAPAPEIAQQRFADQVAAVPVASAAASAGRIAFTLPAPVSIRSGETANLPFLDARLPAERLWWVQQPSARHPLQAVRITNGTGHVLPDGLATLYGADAAEAGAFLGDAELRAMAPGEARLLAFGQDRDLALNSAHSSSERPVRIEQRRGVVVVTAMRREETALAIDPHGARGKLVVDLPRRAEAQPQFSVAAQGDFGLRHEAMLDGSPTTLRFAWDRETKLDLPLWDAGLGDPILLRWRELDLDASQRRLPGGPGTLESLRAILQRLPADAPGRATLDATVQALEAVRQKLDAARAAIRQYRTADAALARARDAAKDRSGPELQEARARLNRASQDAERAGLAADAAWSAWQQAAQELLAREG